jgi:hypothetical protein
LMNNYHMLYCLPWQYRHVMNYYWCCCVFCRLGRLR